MKRSLFLSVLCASVAAMGCSEAHDSVQPDTGRIEVSAAALSLSGIDFACYDLLIENGNDETVVSFGDPALDLSSPTSDTETICSTDFGNGAGGDITYIAPCDAQEPNHTVTLWVDGLYTGTPASPTQADFQDPCPNGCELPVTCVANEDALVNFDLAVMRPADQGFFDIAVSFSDIFCSAKLDCAYGVDDPIELLFNPATGAREQTAILALACTSGATAVAEPDQTVLFRDPIVVDCGGNITVLDPAAGEGNIYSAASPDPDLTDSIWQYAVYSGNESLPCGAFACNKRFWNVAIGFDPTVANCTVTTSATAAPPEIMPGHTTPNGSAYPWIDVDVNLTGPAGGLACSQHPLTGTPAGLATRYTALNAPELFCHRMDSSLASLCTEPTASVIGSRTTGSPGRWSDGTYAASCDDYLNPGAGYLYAGSTGDGVYTIDSNGAGGGDEYDVYCDMTTDGGGWTRLASSLYPAVFSDTVGPTYWEDTNGGAPESANFSALARRTDAAFVTGGCSTMRVTVGDGPGAFVGQTEFTVWEQCHDAFTTGTDGTDYTFIDGSLPAAQLSQACGGFNGLHTTWVRVYARADDVDTNDVSGCWRMQIVPQQLYVDEPGYYLDGFDPAMSQGHQWQAVWYR